MEELSSLRVLHEEKRAECIKLQTEYQELEERFFRSKVYDKEKMDNQLKVINVIHHYIYIEHNLCRTFKKRNFIIS